LWANNSIKRLDTLRYNHLDIFKDLTDISKLERLHTGNIWSPEYFREPGATGDRFESLKDLAVDLERCHSMGLPALEHFLETCKPLERLCVSNSLGQLSFERWLSRHGGTLHKLELHDTETYDLSRPRPIYSLEVIQQISEICPLLENLTIDLGQSDDGKSERAVFTFWHVFQS
jgi:hypothetical protein